MTTTTLNNLIARDAFEQKAIETARRVLADGKQPHGTLREILLDMTLRQAEI